MKNQYFGDVNDYKKYGLLRILSGYAQFETAVCWLLTEDDDRSDGRRIRYLQKPEKWRGYDPDLFDYLRELVIESRVRDISALEQSNILPNCRFYSELIEDNLASRQIFFREFLDFAHGVDLVFFDPDNGLEVNSVPEGKRYSSKYLYWSEVKTTYSAGHSLLIYQHLPRRPRAPFIADLIRRFGTVTCVPRVFSYCTDHVVFFLVPQPCHEKLFMECNVDISYRWRDKIAVVEHRNVEPGASSGLVLVTQVGEGK